MSYTEQINSIMQWGNSFERQGNFPLDRTSLHYSYVDALKYAKGDASDERGLGKLAHYGQIITVLQAEKDEDNNIEPGVWVYKLVPSSDPNFFADLEPVGIETKPITEDDIKAIVNGVTEQ